MPEEQQPVYVSDERTRDVGAPLFLAAIVFVGAATAIFLFKDPVGSAPALPLLIIGPVILCFSAYNYLNSPRAEFYEEFVRIATRKGVEEIPYSKLSFRLVQVKGMGGGSELARLSSEGDGKLHLTVSDKRIPKLNMMLLRWLRTKIEQPMEP